MYNVDNWDSWLQDPSWLCNSTFLNEILLRLQYTNHPPPHTCSPLNTAKYASLTVYTTETFFLEKRIVIYYNKILFIYYFTVCEQGYLNETLPFVPQNSLMIWIEPEFFLSLIHAHICKCVYVFRHEYTKMHTQTHAKIHSQGEFQLLLWSQLLLINVVICYF